VRTQDDAFMLKQAHSSLFDLIERLFEALRVSNAY
jgi:hypothetical protein